MIGLILCFFPLSTACDVLKSYSISHSVNQRKAKNNIWEIPTINPILMDSELLRSGAYASWVSIWKTVNLIYVGDFDRFRMQKWDQMTTLLFVHLFFCYLDSSSRNCSLSVTYEGNTWWGALWILSTDCILKAVNQFTVNPLTYTHTFSLALPDSIFPIMTRTIRNHFKILAETKQRIPH